MACDDEDETKVDKNVEDDEVDRDPTHCSSGGDIFHILCLTNEETEQEQSYLELVKNFKLVRKSWFVGTQMPYQSQDGHWAEIEEENLNRQASCSKSNSRT